MPRSRWSKANSSQGRLLSKPVVSVSLKSKAIISCSENLLFSPRTTLNNLISNHLPPLHPVERVPRAEAVRVPETVFVPPLHPMERGLGGEAVRVPQSFFIPP